LARKKDTLKITEIGNIYIYSLD